MKLARWTFAATALVAGVLVLRAPALAALAPLPADGSQVNDDPANAIDPNQDAGVSDVTGGAVTAGKLEVPWATFEQKVGSAQQIFVRAFKNGAWVTQGFPASLNIDPTKEAEAPASTRQRQTAYLRAFGACHGSNVPARQGQDRVTLQGTIVGAQLAARKVSRCSRTTPCGIVSAAARGT